jgi:hypothetical protein
MADDDEERPQDPHVERLRPDPSQPPQQARTLVGFFGDSDRPGMRRLYFTEALDSYAEFRTDDVLSLVPVPAEQAPFPGHQVTKVMLRRDATVDYTYTHTPKPVDEFDLDAQFSSSPITPFLPRPTSPTVCLVASGCNELCVLTLLTCTCDTQCGQPTCTCNTQCGQPTCAQTCTCNTQCGQQTCVQTDPACTKSPCCP